MTFPSGETVDGLGGEARCMTCHQGRASGKDVDTQITAAAVASDDERLEPRCASRTSTTTRPRPRCSPGAPRAATSTPGRSTTFASATSTAMNTCIGCHDPHSTKVALRRLRRLPRRRQGRRRRASDPDDVVDRHRLRRRRQHQRGDLRRARRSARQGAGAASCSTARSAARRSVIQPPAIPTGSSTPTATAPARPPR